ncbi:MAG: hypothetical protein PUC06_08595 [Oscillospiraceae bacterium]|nr:hypothetical protein [Oscillospiraceae bacterium]
MRKLLLTALFILLLGCPVLGLEAEGTEADWGTAAMEQALPRDARELLGDYGSMETAELSGGVGAVLSGAMEQSGDAIRGAVGLCCQLLAVALLAGTLRGFGGGKAMEAMELVSVLAVGALCMGQVSGGFTRAAETVASMSAFSGFLFAVLASATAATGAVGTATGLYGITMAVCGILSRGLETLFLPGISCYAALMVANFAVGDDSLKLAADGLKQILTSILKAVVIGFTAYLSLTGVIRGSADAAAIRAAKLTISTAIPVVGSIVADASETLLVSAGLIRSGAGVFGLLGTLAVAIVPFLETGISYLSMKLSAAIAGALGEKQVSGLIAAMAGAMGLVTAVTGVCALLIMIGCVCFMRTTGGV